MAIAPSVKISTAASVTRDSEELARELTETLEGGPGLARTRVALSGTSDAAVAAIALNLVSRGHQVLLEPTGLTHSEQPPMRATYQLRADACGQAGQPLSSAGPPPDGTWQLGLYSSGSSGHPRAYGFTVDQLDPVARWYASVYRVTAASAIVTSLPTSYNFTFVAGLCLAAHIGARLHLSVSPGAARDDAAHLGREHDRVVVLANPVLLELTGRGGPRLPGNVLIDSGGAPLSAPGIALLREQLGDVREGYGLTETASLTHFDTEGTSAPLGTVGTSMPGVRCWIDLSGGRPRIGLDSPATGVELYPDGTAGPERSTLLTGDLGNLDPAGRLRLLGRSDDCEVSGLWPRDTLDLIGDLLGIRCALVRHPEPGRIHVQVLGALAPPLGAELRARIRERTGSAAAVISVSGQHGLLHSQKMPRTSADRPKL